MNLAKQLELAKKTGCLYVSNMNLRYLPEIPEYVQELHCNNNRLMDLPPLPKSLRRLSCDNNFLQSLPKLPKSLLFLYCSNNRLRVLPSLPKNLVEMDCSRNRIVRLPKLPHQLYFLRVSHNRLLYLPPLPESLSMPIMFLLEPTPDLDKFTYIVFHNNDWNPLFESYLAKGLVKGVRAYHADINRRLQNMAALQTIRVLHDDVLACIGSFLTGINSHSVKQTKGLLDMIE
jgi:hypothetical protein